MSDSSIGVVTCERCQKQLIAEELKNHVCTPQIVGVREILVDSCFTVKNENGDRVTIATGLDNGIMYRLVECNHVPSHRKGPRLKPTRRKLTGGNSDGDLPEPNMIKISSIYGYAQDCFGTSGLFFHVSQEPL